MKPDTFKEANMIMGAGGNPSTEDLPLCKATTPSIPGVNFLVSRWKLEPAEVKKIKETGEIWISIMGDGMPPIMPMAYHLFNDSDFKPVDI